MDNLFDLSGKVAVITGGSRGLGLAMAQAFAAHGADLVIASRKLPACEQVAASIRQKYGRKVMAVQYHAGHWQDSDALVEQVNLSMDGIDILVNNAGMSPLYSSLGSVSEEMFNKVLAVNFMGPFRLSTIVAEQMVAAGTGGSIINISSVAAVQPDPGELPYASAKAAMNTMTIGLARAFGPTVRANVIMPGPFLTDVAEHWDTASLQTRTATIPLRRGGQPDEIVGAALYLASAASSYTTGAVLRVDGGSAAAPM